MNTATFLALVQSVGFVPRTDGTALIPAISVRVTRTDRTRHGVRETADGLLLVASVGIELRKRRR